MQNGFGTTLPRKPIDGATHRVREGSIDLPTELVGAVEAVLGLDNRPQAQPHFRIAGEQDAIAARTAQGNGFASPHANSNVSYTPVQVAKLYQFPSGVTPANQTIGIIDPAGASPTTAITTSSNP